jgi:hypothetical protein
VSFELGELVGSAQELRSGFTGGDGRVGGHATILDLSPSGGLLGFVSAVPGRPPRQPPTWLDAALCAVPAELDLSWCVVEESVVHASILCF